MAKYTTKIQPKQRFSKNFPCPICGGYQEARKGTGTRCFGFLADNWALCTREEFAGSLPMNPESKTFAHLLIGECKCGKTHNPRVKTMKNKMEKPIREIRYKYQDENGNPHMQVIRQEYEDGGKKFIQCRYENGKYIPGLNGLQPVLYRLPELIWADPMLPVLIVEGEKLVNLLVENGFISTCNPMGAGCWRDEYNHYLQGRDVVLLPDNDAPGQRHVEKIAHSLQGIARSIRIIELPGLPDAGDVVDWFNAGGTAAALREIINNAPVWEAVESLKTATRKNLTDLGNAERFYEQHHGEIHYLEETGALLCWNGKYFAPGNGTIKKKAFETVRSIYAEAAEEQDPDRRKAIAQFAQRSESRQRIESMIELSKAFFSTSLNLFDKNKYLLNLQNGTYDLKSDNFRQHRKEDLLTKISPVSYDPAADCPLWKQFMNEIMQGDESKICFLQKAVGYSLCGNTSERKFFILYGSGKNGKSVFLKIIQSLLGPDYSRQTAAETLMQRRYEGNANEDVARLNGARFVSSSESKEWHKFDSAKVKHLTGDEPVTARFLFQNTFQFTPQHKIWLATNNKPRIDAYDQALWDRLCLIFFGYRPEQEDKYLSDKLEAELPGILNWAIEGFRLWQIDGLEQPESIRAAAQEYRQEMDILQQFIDECCIKDTGCRVSAKEFHELYAKYSLDSGEKPLSQKALSGKLQEMGFNRARSTGGRFYWEGIGILTDKSEPSEPSEPFSINTTREGKFYRNLPENASLTSLSSLGITDSKLIEEFKRDVLMLMNSNGYDRTEAEKCALKQFKIEHPGYFTNGSL